MLFSYFSYAAALTRIEGRRAIDIGLLGIALLVAPFVFVVIGFVSRSPGPLNRALVSMGLLLVLGLVLGLISPLLGAAAGFGVGAALTLNRPELPDVMRNRLVGVGFAIVYMLTLLLVATPGGVFTGALLPTLMVGFADDFTAWRASRAG